MDDAGILKLLGGYGLGGILAFILGRVMWRVGERMIAAIDKLIAKVDEHTKADLEHHAIVHSEIVALGARVDGIVSERDRTGLTPVHGVPTEWAEVPTPGDSPKGFAREQLRRPRTPARGSMYSHKRPKTNPTEE